DQMKFWANATMLLTWPGNGERQSAKGILSANEVRGFGWALRILGDTAAYLPDADPDRAYFAQKVTNNLQWLESYVATASTPLGAIWTERPRFDTPAAPYFSIAPWEQYYLAWAIDHVLQL